MSTLRHNLSPHHTTLALLSALVIASVLGACRPEDQKEEEVLILIDLPTRDADADEPDSSPDMPAEPMDTPADVPQLLDEGMPVDVEDMTADQASEPVYIMPTIAGQTVLEDVNPAQDVVEVNLRAKLTMVDIGNGTVLNMMAYNGSVPGPLLQVKKGDTLIVHFTNELDEPTTVHWHGLRIPDDMDGSPRIQDPVKPGETFTYTFVVPDAGTYWYHPHVRANEQVEKGLYGPIVVHDPTDPQVDVERVIMVDDILLNATGIAPFFQGHMEGVHGRTGNTLLVNGTSDIPSMPDTTVGLVERWRVINPANARTFVLGLPDTSFRVIATDGGVLPEPYLTDRIEVAVGQRYDLEVLTQKNASHTLTAYIPTLNAQDQIVESAFPLHEVTRQGQVFDVGVPEPREWLGEAMPDVPATREETYVFDGFNNALGQLVWTINGKAHNMEPISVFNQDEVVAITLENKQGPEHPFHLHGQFFTIVDDGFGQSMPGLKDTVLVPGQRTVKIVAYMNNPGTWMAHCHILEHAELGMMSEIKVLAP